MLPVENNFNKIGLPHVYIASFRCPWVSGGGLEPFRGVLHSGGWLPLKKNTRLATHWPNDPHSNLRKFQVSKVYLNHPRIAGFPTLAFHFCPVSTRIRLSWAQDLNFKVSDRAIVTKGNLSTRRFWGDGDVSKRVSLGKRVPSFAPKSKLKQRVFLRRQPIRNLPRKLEKTFCEKCLFVEQERCCY